MLYIKFHGAGWLFPFYFGVAKYIKEHLDISSDGIRIGGVSAGAVTAAMLLLDTDFDIVLNKVLEKHKHMRYNPFMIKDTLHNILVEHLPEQLEKIQDKLVIGLSRLDFPKFVWKSHTISNYPSKNHCIDIIKASCHIPLISGMMPYYVDGAGYYDGDITGLTDINDATRMISVNVQGGSCIGPGVFIPKIWHYYPADPFVLRMIMELGYQQAHRYFWEHTDTIGPFVKAPIKPFKENPVYKDIIAYSISKGEVCSIKRPLATLMLGSMSFKGVVFFALWIALKRTAYKKIREWIISMINTLRKILHQGLHIANITPYIYG